jgi:hypothetical protein
MGGLLKMMMGNIIKNIFDLLNHKINNKSFLGKKTQRNNFDNHEKSKNKNNQKTLKEKKENSSLTLRENTNDNNENFNITDKENNHTHITVGKNIVNYLSEKATNYSYKLISRIFNFEIKKGQKNEEYFPIVLKNDGKNKWLEDESYLIFRKTNCPEVIIKDIKLKPLGIGDIETFQIKFDNLAQCPKGKYRAIFSIVINNNIIKDKDNAEIFLIHFKVI